MSENTPITWATHTFNPWWGCTEVSPGCDHCYAREWARRHGLEWGEVDDKGDPVARRFFGETHWKAPEAWDRKAARLGERHRVFCASMGDVFEDRPELIPHRARLFELIAATPNLDWLLLTKRPDNLRRMLPWAPQITNPTSAAIYGAAPKEAWGDEWPNVWIGVTTENQEQAARRLHEALQVPAVVHFASYEPALGEIDYRTLKMPAPPDVGRSSCRHDAWSLDALVGVYHCAFCGVYENQPYDRLDWIVMGDESGKKRRPADANWFRHVIHQVDQAGMGTKVHLKQWAGEPTHGIDGVRRGRDGKIHLPTLDGTQYAEFPEVA